VIAETMDQLGEALLATEVIKKAGLVAVITMATPAKFLVREGLGLVEAFKKLKVRSNPLLIISLTPLLSTGSWC